MHHELALGWMTRYAVGLVYAALLVALVAEGWLARPTLLPTVALLVERPA